MYRLVVNAPVFKNSSAWPFITRFIHSLIHSFIQMNMKCIRRSRPVTQNHHKLHYHLICRSHRPHDVHRARPRLADHRCNRMICTRESILMVITTAATFFCFIIKTKHTNANTSNTIIHSLSSFRWSMWSMLIRRQNFANHLASVAGVAATAPPLICLHFQEFKRVACARTCEFSICLHFSARTCECICCKSCSIINSS